MADRDDLRTPELEAGLRRDLSLEAGQAEPSLEDVQRRTISYRRRMLVLRFVSAIAFVGLVAAGIPLTLGAFRAAEKAAAMAEVPDHRAGTFVLRAVTQAGLRQPRGEEVLSYLGLDRADDHWEAHFQGLRCISTKEMYSCDADERYGGQSAILEVRLVEDRLRVVGAPDQIPGPARAALLEYSETPDELQPHPEISEVEVLEGAERGTLSVEAVGYWVGPIPAERLFFGCFIQAFDSDEQLVHDGHAFLFESPEGESQRDSGTFVTQLPASSGAARAEMMCEPFTGPGWEVEGQLEVRQPEDAAHARVLGRLVWPGRGIYGIELRCTTTVFDLSGEVVGEVTYQTAGPWPLNRGAGPPFHRDHEVVVDVPGGQRAVSASFDCRMPAKELEPDNGVEEPRTDFGGPTPPREPPARPTAPRPEGPKHIVAMGTLVGEDWGALDGIAWTIYIQGDGDSGCWSFDLDDGEKPGASCWHEPASLAGSSVVGGVLSIPSAGHGDGENVVMVGEVGQAVRSVVVVLSNGRQHEGTIYEPPSELGLESNFFVAELGPSEAASVKALDAEGNELEERDLGHN